MPSRRANACTWLMIDRVIGTGVTLCLVMKQYVWSCRSSWPSCLLEVGQRYKKSSKRGAGVFLWLLSSCVLVVHSLQVHACNGIHNLCFLEWESSTGQIIWRLYVCLGKKLISLLPLLPDIWLKCMENVCKAIHDLMCRHVLVLCSCLFGMWNMCFGCCVIHWNWRVLFDGKLSSFSWNSLSQSTSAI